MDAGESFDERSSVAEIMKALRGTEEANEDSWYIEIALFIAMLFQLNIYCIGRRYSLEKKKRQMQWKLIHGYQESLRGN